MALLFFLLSSLSASFPSSLLRLTCMQPHTVTDSVQWCCASEFSWWLYWLFQLFLFTLLCRMTSVMVPRRPTLWSSRSTSWILSRTIGITLLRVALQLGNQWVPLQLSYYQHFSSWISGVLTTWCSVSVVLGSVVSTCWCSIFTLKAISSCFTVASHFLSLIWRAWSASLFSVTSVTSSLVLRVFHKSSSLFLWPVLSGSLLM